MGDHGMFDAGFGEALAFDEPVRRDLRTMPPRAGPYAAASNATAADSAYDDLFDNQMMRTALSSSSRPRPEQWPRSASEMRSLTNFEGQGLDSQAMASSHMAWALPRGGAAQNDARRAVMASMGGAQAPRRPMQAEGFGDSRRVVMASMGDGFSGIEGFGRRGGF